MAQCLPLISQSVSLSTAALDSSHQKVAKVIGAVFCLSSLVCCLPHRRLPILVLSFAPTVVLSPLYRNSVLSLSHIVPVVFVSRRAAPDSCLHRKLFTIWLLLIPLPTQQHSAWNLLFPKAQRTQIHFFCTNNI